MDRHEMYLDKRYESGNMILQCPKCPRRIMISYDEQGLTVIEKGDENAVHSSSIGGLKITGFIVEQEE